MISVPSSPKSPLSSLLKVRGAESLFGVIVRLTAAVDDMAQRLDDMESAIKAGNESGSEGK
jgi:hypothetical protein